MRLVTPLAAVLVLAPFVSAPATAYVPDEEPLEAPRPAPGGLSPATRQILPDVPGEAGEEESGETFDDAPGDHSSGLQATSVPAPRATIGDVNYGMSDLPPPVARARTDLLDAASTGDIEALRPIFARQRGAPLVGSGMSDDPVESLRLQSGDEHGREILAILSELLETGHVLVGEGSTATYVWPYFAEVPLEELKPRHYVELYRVLTAIDVEEMARLGRYTFFRIGIAPDGRVRYFSAGEIE